VFKDVYRQIYPFNGEVIVLLGQNRASFPITENPEVLFGSKGRERFMVATFVIGPKDDGSAQELPPPLVFNVNVNADYSPNGDSRPPLSLLGKVLVGEFEANGKISLLAPFPSLAFDYEKRTSGFDELGNPIDPRYVVSGVGAIAGDSRGPATPFVNPVTNQRTLVTLNTEFFLECFASRVSAAASEF
jgi:hypothetical protein